MANQVKAFTAKAANIAGKVSQVFFVLQTLASTLFSIGYSAIMLALKLKDTAITVALIVLLVINLGVCVAFVAAFRSKSSRMKKSIKFTRYGTKIVKLVITLASMFLTVFVLVKQVEGYKFLEFVLWAFLSVYILFTFIQILFAVLQIVYTANQHKIAQKAKQLVFKNRAAPVKSGAAAGEAAGKGGGAAAADPSAGDASAAEVTAADGSQSGTLSDAGDSSYIKYETADEP